MRWAVSHRGTVFHIFLAPKVHPQGPDGKRHKFLGVLRCNFCVNPRSLRKASIGVSTARELPILPALRLKPILRVLGPKLQRLLTAPDGSLCSYHFCIPRCSSISELERDDLLNMCQGLHRITGQVPMQMSTTDYYSR